MVFPPQFLPKRSWQKLVETLADHFGENASLGEAQRKAVLALPSRPCRGQPERRPRGPEVCPEHRRRPDTAPHHGDTALGAGTPEGARRSVAGSQGEVEGELPRVSQGRRARRLRGLSALVFKGGYPHGNAAPLLSRLLKDSREWSLEDDVERALSEEALISAAMSRHHVSNSVRRELAFTLGKLRAA